MPQQIEVLRELTPLEKVAVERSRRMLGLIRELAATMVCEQDCQTAEDYLARAFFIYQSVNTQNLSQIEKGARRSSQHDSMQ